MVILSVLMWLYFFGFLHNEKQCMHPHDRWNYFVAEYLSTVRRASHTLGAKFANAFAEPFGERLVSYSGLLGHGPFALAILPVSSP